MAHWRLKVAEANSGWWHTSFNSVIASVPAGLSCSCCHTVWFSVMFIGLLLMLTITQSGLKPMRYGRVVFLFFSEGIAVQQILKAGTCPPRWLSLFFTGMVSPTGTWTPPLALWWLLMAATDGLLGYKYSNAHIVIFLWQSVIGFNWTAWVHGKDIMLLPCFILPVTKELQKYTLWGLGWCSDWTSC